MIFRKGQKVVCIDAGRMPDWLPPYRWNYDPLVEGAIYTVAGACNFFDDTILLEELRNTDGRLPDIGYRRCRFRPLTDISIFTEMLKTTPVKVLEDV